MTMVEKIARALEPIAWAALGSGDTRRFFVARLSSLAKAARILEGPLMDPTKSMTQAGGEVLLNKKCPPWEASDVWRAMLTKALSEAEEEGK